MVEARFAKNLAAIEVVNRNDDRKWRVTDTIRKNDKDYVRFNSAMQLQRPGLLLLNGTIYSAFGARADQDPYHGWVFAHAADTLELKGVFCTSTNGQRAGIWQAGEGICADNEGNIYVGTGNGDILRGNARCSKSAPAAIANIERGRREKLVHCRPAAATSSRFSTR
jgi:hypothetical protein